MKSFTSTLLFFVLTFSLAHAQEQQLVSNDSIYSSVDVNPQYPEGMIAFSQFIADHFEMHQSGFKGGTVIASFIVNTDGSLSDIKILRDPGFGAGDEIKRLLGIAEKWKAAELKGIKVRTTVALPIALPEFKAVPFSGETQPEYPGGRKMFYEYFGRNFREPEVEIDPSDKEKYPLYVRLEMGFVIAIDGSLTEIHEIEDPAFGPEIKRFRAAYVKEAIRVLRNSPKWKPATKNGVAVPVKYVFPIVSRMP